jgi:hypothetical protein
MNFGMSYDEWLEFGIQQKFISKPFCWVHDSPDLTDDEMEMTGGGEDLDAICVFAVRLTPTFED